MPLRKGLSKYLKDKSINRSNLLGVGVGAVFIFIFAFLVAYQEYDNFTQELVQVEDDYMVSQKNLIVKDTERALRYIEYMYKKYNGKIPTDTIQKQVVDAIEQMRDQRDGSGYIFVYTFEGINIADPILSENHGKNMLGFKDPAGKAVIKELIDVSQNDKGGFVEYIWNKPTTNKLSPKISYAASFAPWNWMVGSGVYIDSIQEVLKERREAYKKGMVEFVFKVLMLAGILFFAVALISQTISNAINKEVDSFITFFKDAAAKKLYINRNELGFVEFQEISIHANEMVDEIKEKTEALEEMNRTLEQKVEQKTQKLQIQAEELKEVISRQDRFLKNSIHEVFTPISIIFANIDLLKLQGKSDGHLEKIEASAKTIKNIYDDLSYLVKKDIQTFTTKKINLGEFIAQRIEYFYELAVGNALVFQHNIQGDFRIEFNETELQRIVDNTFSNAIKYSKKNTEIRVELLEGIFKVTNTGKAIKDLSKLFERHYREDEARGGFGIGLNIVKDICDKNGVEVSVACEGDEVTFMYNFAKTVKQA